MLHPPHALHSRDLMGGLGGEAVSHPRRSQSCVQLWAHWSVLVGMALYRYRGRQKWTVNLALPVRRVGKREI